MRPVLAVIVVLAISGSALASCPTKLEVDTLAPGLTVERKRPSLSPVFGRGEPCLWIVRFDPRQFSLALLAGPMKTAKTPLEWIKAGKLIGVINAAMYTPSGRPTGLTIANGKVVNGGDSRGYGAFFAFGPRSKGLPAAVMAGRDCKGFDLAALKRNYRNVVQNYRLLDCHGKPIAWKDPKPYSAAAVAVDRKGRVAFVHMVESYPMTRFAKILADRELGFVRAMYVEGGSPAQLSLRYGKRAVDRIGAYEALVFKSGGKPEKLPNVLGFRRR
jgi:hypothetical protein